MICVNCSNAGNDCCHLLPHEGDEVPFGLTVGDLRRIVGATGLRPEEFALIIDQAPREFVEDITEKLPGTARMFAHAKRISIKLGEDRACYFWRAGAGCTLSTEDRPRWCALYPNWYVPDGASVSVYLLTLGDEHRCPAVATCVENENPVGILALLGIQAPTLISLARASNEELDEHARMTWDEIEAVYRCVRT